MTRRSARITQPRPAAAAEQDPAYVKLGRHTGQGYGYRHPRMKHLENPQRHPLFKSALSKATARAKTNQNVSKFDSILSLIGDTERRWGVICESTGEAGEGPCSRCIKRKVQCIVPLKPSSSGDIYLVSGVCLNCKLGPGRCDINQAPTRVNKPYIRRESSPATHKKTASRPSSNRKPVKRTEAKIEPPVGKMEQEVKGFNQWTGGLATDPGESTWVKAHRGLQAFIEEMFERQTEKNSYTTQLIFEKARTDLVTLSESKDKDGVQAEAALAGFEDFVNEMRRQCQPFDYGLRLVFAKVDVDQQCCKEVIIKSE